MGSLRVGHDWTTSPSLFTFMHWRRKWQPTPVFLPGESQGRRSLVGCRLQGCTESDSTEATQLQHPLCRSSCGSCSGLYFSLPSALRQTDGQRRERGRRHDGTRHLGLSCPVSSGDSGLLWCLPKATRPVGVHSCTLPPSVQGSTLFHQRSWYFFKGFANIRSR